MQKSHSQIPSLASVAFLRVGYTGVWNSQFTFPCCLSHGLLTQCSMCLYSRSNRIIYIKTRPVLVCSNQFSHCIVVLWQSSSRGGGSSKSRWTRHEMMDVCGWGQRYLPRVSTGTAAGLLALGQLFRTHWSYKNHEGIEAFLSYCSAVGRSKRERKDQLPLKAGGREASPAGLPFCLLAAKNCTAFGFPLSCGKFMDIKGETISWLYCSLWDIHILSFFWSGFSWAEKAKNILAGLLLLFRWKAAQFRSCSADSTDLRCSKIHCEAGLEQWQWIWNRLLMLCFPFILVTPNTVLSNSTEMMSWYELLWAALVKRKEALNNWLKLLACQKIG